MQIKKMIRSLALVVPGILFPATGGILPDQLPVEWKLPNKGKGCKQLHSFHEKITCGAAAYQIWECPDATKKNVKVTYLVTGLYKSDVSNTCSPTFVVEKVLPSQK